MKMARSIEKSTRRQSQYQIAEMPPVSIMGQFGGNLATDKVISLTY
jgi:hypothetical protein